MNEWKKIRRVVLKTKERKQGNFELTNEVEEDRNLSRYWYREHKDYLDIKEQYDSLFLVGSKEVFINISFDALSVCDEGRDLFSRFPGYHAHEHIDYYARKEYTKNFKHDGWSLCLDFYDCELWER
ncbi:hypothetical protein GJB61_28705 [Paenibacillus sp. LC-T2]|uniref:Uncharacterized protein n=2 Tax=Paenibacillus monticola TaxID=2666075 RepID=A0A7X2L510_9BACL|nr:hypothetical protein [Paenibacillus monticola]